MHILEGRERVSGEPLSVAISGSDPFKTYLAKLAFQGLPEERLLGRARAWSVPALVKNLAPDCALLAWKIPFVVAPFFSRSSFARLPWWVDMNIDLQGEPSVFLKKSRFLRNKAMVKSRGFTQERTQDEAAVFDFYHNLYVPYVKQRHGEIAGVRPYEETRTAVLSGRWELMLVKLDGQTLGGAAIDVSGPLVRVRDFGVRDGAHENLTQGTAAALYHFLLTTLHERGIPTLDLGNCRPFIGDGVLQYKRSLGGYLTQPDIPNGGLIDLRALKNTPGLSGFLVNNLFVRVGRGNRLKLSVFVERLSAEAERELELIREKYCFKGTVEARLVPVAELFSLMPDTGLPAQTA